MTPNLPHEMIILAGGFGTRLQQIVRDVPKPMALVCGRPFLSHVIDYWTTHGVDRFVLSTGYLANIIQDYFGQTYRGATIEYVCEPAPLGTGGALRMVLNTIQFCKKNALMVNGDTWFPADIEKLCTDAEIQQLPLTLTLTLIENNNRYGGVDVCTDGRIRTFGMETQNQSLINAGCYLFDVNRISQALQSLPQVFSLEKDFLTSFAASRQVGSSQQSKPFLDIGIPEDYLKAENYFKVKT